jgi:hypothetical protein
VVADYVCIDGPLEGRRFRWRRAPRTGEPMTVALLDVEHGVLEVDYRVQPAGEAADAGRLEFVAARDAHLARRRLGLPGRSGRSGGRGSTGTSSTLRSHLGRLRRPFGWVHA